MTAPADPDPRGQPIPRGLPSARPPAARCIEAYLRSSLKVPGRYSGRATFSYAF